MIMVLPLRACVVGLLLVLETPSSAVAQTLTSNPTGNIFCNGSEVIFTCETIGSLTLTWRSNSIYIEDQVSFIAAVNNVNDIRSGSSSDIVATLTQNDQDSGVLVSTLRLVVSSVAPSGFVRCIRDSGTEDRIDFTVFALPAVPQNVVTFQLEHVRDMCAIASVVQGPTNPAEADATNYTVRVDGSIMPFRDAEFISTDGMRHSALVYESSCGAHNISISASNMCGESPGTDVIMLNPDQRIMLNVTVSSASKIECSVATVVVCTLVAFKYLYDLR